MIVNNRLVLCAAAALCMVATAGVVWAAYALWRAKRTMRRLEAMLELAAEGGFEQQEFSERQLSRLEARMTRFLRAGALSNQRLENERVRLKELIGDISHQTKTPLANVLLYTQLLQEQPLPSAALPLAAQVGAQAEKLQFLIEALVKMSRLETGVVQIKPGCHQVEALLERTMAAYRQAASEKGIDLTVHCAPQAAWFDLKWTAEALGNLVDNAVKYTPPGGKVSVACTASPMFCRITVQDNGPGIPEAEQAAVFTRFYRSAAVHTQPGVGVGLYLARQIAGLQGGYIKLESKSGRGCAFSLYLPLESQM